MALRRVRGALIGAAVVAALVAGAGGYAVQVYRQSGPLPAARAVVVPRGGLAAVAASLQAAGVVRDAVQFHIAALATFKDGPLHAAELRFPPGASLRDVLTILRTAKPVEHRLTIAEGLTAAQIAVLLQDAPALTGETPVPAEGAVLPQTYAYEYGTPRAALLGRAEAAMSHALDQTWQARAPDLPLSSARQALILASIIERETARPEERPLIAAVFLNRLRLGMKLQSDPTVIYGVSGGSGGLDRPLSRADLAHDDAYNTYRIDGLPAAPICAPGLASLVAATRPASTDDLYFVADGAGGHAFARTLEAHERNVAHWRTLPDVMHK